MDFSLSCAKTSLKHKTIIHDYVRSELRAKIAHIPGGVKRLARGTYDREKRR